MSRHQLKTVYSCLQPLEERLGYGFATNSNGIGSGGGIYLRGGVTTLQNSVIAGNIDISTTAPDVDFTSANVAAGLQGGFILLGNNKGTNLLAGELIGTDSSPIDPRLGL